MIRLDKYLCHAGYGTRKELKKVIRNGWVCVNGKTIRNDDFKIDEMTAEVLIDGTPVSYQKYYYIMLNKRSGYVIATIDDHYPTVLDLIDEDYAFHLFPVGRLDVDTEGLLLLTNDGQFSHNLISPRKHVDKEYYVELDHEYTDEDIFQLTKGVRLNEEETPLPANVERINDNSMYLTIQEGKYHQVKRMMHAIDNEVVYLQRVRIGSLVLDKNLPLGGYRPLQGEEITALLK